MSALTKAEQLEEFASNTLGMSKKEMAQFVVDEMLAILDDPTDENDEAVKVFQGTVYSAEWYVENLMRTKGFDVESAVGFGTQVVNVCVDGQNWRRFDT